MNNKLFLSDNLSGQKRCFEPCRYDRITIYACGPTVYKVPHLGNFRSFTIFDTLYRFLTYLYPNVIYVRNITDIDDKIIDQARAQNIDPKLLTNSVIESFSMYCEKLNLLPPTFEPKVTDFMNEIIADIQTLIINGFAYEKSHHVMFDTTKYDDYRKFCKDMNTCTGARVEVSVLKNNENDFVLWKPADDFGWDSPWGYGRPGWHIECTSMSRKILGFPFDIHCGGQDLIFPHHTNERAQGWGLCKTECANYWIHNNFVNIDGEKISKSLGNSFDLEELFLDYNPMVVRLFLLSANYKHPLHFSSYAMKNAENLYNKWHRKCHHYNIIGCGRPLQSVVDALSDDLNTPLAITRITEAINDQDNINSQIDVEEILASLDLLGIKFYDHEIDKEINDLINKREIARQNKDYVQADEIRDVLLSRNIVLEDTKLGVKWYKK
ncbi:MAG: cysteine--tRNA ligase [Alphaproteobacteria bacterium]|nr:MAG: cysteine--tRNA ligase [Alphaproteobacteria bacterium]